MTSQVCVAVDMVDVCVLVVSDASSSDPMPIYAHLTKGRNLFAGQSSSHVRDDSSLDRPPTRRCGDSQV